MKQFARIAQILLLLALPLLAVACREEDPKDCAKAACSEQFNEIKMIVKDADGKPVMLDTFKLVNMFDKSAINLSFTGDAFAEMKESGRYLLMDDSMAPQHRNSQLVVEFSAIYNQKKSVAKSAVTINIDCCHVSYYYGDTTLVVRLDPAPADE